jgi:hypothetical protein
VYHEYPQLQGTSGFLSCFGIDLDLRRENNSECAETNPAYMEDWLVQNVQDLHIKNPREGCKGLEIDEDDRRGRRDKSGRPVLVLLQSRAGRPIAYNPKKFNRKRNVGWHHE